MVYYKKKGIVWLIILLLGLFCYIWIKGYYNDSVLKGTLFDITQEIGCFPTDEIYLIDLASRAYRSVEFTGESVSDSKKYIDVIFLTTKLGRRIAEIMISPMEEKITIKYKFDNYNILLYDPSTGNSICLLECDNSEEWLGYEIQIDQVNEKVEIKRAE